MSTFFINTLFSIITKEIMTQTLEKKHALISPERFVTLSLDSIPILTIIARQSLNEHEVEDAVQETLTNAFERLHAYKQHKGSFQTWLKAIMKNVIIDMKNDKFRSKTTSLTNIEH